MKELYIHVGLHKTATTFLQESLFPNLEGINFIPQSEIMDFLVEVTQDDLGVYDAEKNFNRIDKILVEGKNLISSEGLSGNPLAKYQNRSCTLLKLKKTFPDAKIIVGIRGQKSMLQSIYKQYIRIGGIKSFNNIVKDQPFSHPALYAHDYNTIQLRSFCYENYLTLITTEFKKENVYIYLFEQLRLEKVKFVTGITNFIQVAYPANTSFKSINSAHSDNAYTILLWLNKLQKSYLSEKYLMPKIPDKVIKYFAKILPFKFKISTFDKHYDKIKPLYELDNKKISENYNLPISDEKYRKYYF